MARKIIILERLNEPSDQDFRYLCWCDVPQGRESLYANEKKESVFKDATADETAALQEGRVVEFVDVLSNPAGATRAQIKAKLQAKFAEFQARVTNYNPGKFYGSSWDGSTWTDGGIA